jgi:hypothetical protein
MRLKGQGDRLGSDVPRATRCLADPRHGCGLGPSSFVTPPTPGGSCLGT